MTDFKSDDNKAAEDSAAKTTFGVPLTFTLIQEKEGSFAVHAPNSRGAEWVAGGGTILCRVLEYVQSPDGSTGWTCLASKDDGENWETAFISFPTEEATNE